MCIAIGAMSAASVGQAATLAISTIGTVAGIAQAQQSASFQQQQANLQLQQQRQQAEVQNQQLANQYVGEAEAQNRQRMAYERQMLNDSTAANKAHVQEQTKLNEARTKAAFKAQEIYAKSIGAKGSVLATGATGQSVGLLALDADRQGGLQQAQQDAMVESAARSSELGSDIAFSQKESAANQAYSQLAVPVSSPTFAPSPGGGSISNPTYNWFD